MLILCACVSIICLFCCVRVCDCVYYCWFALFCVLLCVVVLFCVFLCVLSVLCVALCVVVCVFCVCFDVGLFFFPRLSVFVVLVRVRVFGMCFVFVGVFVICCACIVSWLVLFHHMCSIVFVFVLCLFDMFV